MAPNMRVQRTRSSPSALRSPLTRCPLGSRETSRRLIASAGFLAVLSASSPAGPNVAPGPSPAESIEVRATYISPQISGDESNDPSWKVVLRDPGESYLMSGGEKQILSVPSERMAALRGAIAAEQFFKLKNDYGYFPVDGPERRMVIRLGSKEKTVTVSEIKWDMTKRESLEVDRAMRVWFAVMDCFRVPKKAAA